VNRIHGCKVNVGALPAKAIATVLGNLWRLFLLIIYQFFEIAAFIVAETNRARTLGGFHHRERCIAKWAGIQERLVP
jgi:hypothetical protein